MTEQEILERNKARKNELRARIDGLENAALSYFVTLLGRENIEPFTPFESKVKNSRVTTASDNANGLKRYTVSVDIECEPDFSDNFSAIFGGFAAGMLVVDLAAKPDTDA